MILTDEIFDITPVVIYKGNEYRSSLSTIAATDVLLAEDNDLNAEIAVSLLEEQG